MDTTCGEKVSAANGPQAHLGLRLITLRTRRVDLLWTKACLQLLVLFIKNASRGEIFPGLSPIGESE